MASESPHIRPSVELTQAPPKVFFPTQLITINGKLYWVTIVSKTAQGTECYHHLEKEHWEQLTQPIQRVFAANIQGRSEHHKTPLAEKNPKLIEIPLDSAQEPIRYQLSDRTFSLSPEEMTALKAYKGHDLLKEVRQTLRKYEVTPYFSEQEETARTVRLQELSAHHPEHHKKIQSLHTNMRHDITQETFEYYLKEIQEEAKLKQLPTCEDATTLDLSQLIPADTQIFIPIKAHSETRFMKYGRPKRSQHPHLLGLFINRQTHEVVIYDPNNHHAAHTHYPDLQRILDHLKTQDPALRIVYRGSKDQGPTQEKRRLLLFVQTMLFATKPEQTRFFDRLTTLLASDREQILDNFQKELKDSMHTQCYTLAQRVQTRQNRIYEQAQVLGI